MELVPVAEEELEVEEAYLPPGSPAEYPEKPLCVSWGRDTAE